MRKKITIQPIYSFKIKGTPVIVKMKKVAKSTLISISDNYTGGGLGAGMNIHQLNIKEGYAYLRIKSAPTSVSRILNFLLVGKIIKEEIIEYNHKGRDYVKNEIAKKFNIDSHQVWKIIKDKNGLVFNSKVDKEIRSSFASLKQTVIDEKKENNQSLNFVGKFDTTCSEVASIFKCSYSYVKKVIRDAEKNNYKGERANSILTTYHKLIEGKKNLLKSVQG
jgi:hypothetical protein